MHDALRQLAENSRRTQTLVLSSSSVLVAKPLLISDLAHALRNNSNLTALNLRSCGIGDDVGAVLLVFVVVFAPCAAHFGVGLRRSPLRADRGRGAVVGLGAGCEAQARLGAGGGAAAGPQG